MDLHVPDVPKKYLKYFFFYILVLFSLKHPLLKAFLLIKTPKTCINQFWPKKNIKLSKNKFFIRVWKSLNDLVAQNNYEKNIASKNDTLL